MPRPTKRRTEASYRRDVEHLTRLRSAIKLDSQKLGNKLVNAACREIDTLMNRLVELIVRVEANGDGKVKTE